MKNLHLLPKTLLLFSLTIVLSKSTFAQVLPDPIPADVTTWTGAVSTDWFNYRNWDTYSVPTFENDVVIPASMPRYPVISSTTAETNNLTIYSGASLVINSTFQLSGIVINLGTFDARSGTLELNGSTESQVIPIDLFYANKVKNLIINNNVSIESSDTITGLLTLRSGKTFTTNDLLVLKSDANGTASIAAIPTNASGSAIAYINGKVSIERYIPARKAWRFLCMPVKASTAPTINAALQAGAYTNSFAPNSTPNYGVLIAGGTTQNGFDPSPTNAATVKYYNNATNTFLALPSVPGTLTAITSYPAYMMYIRGDRSIDFMQGVNAAVTSTTLQVSGEVVTGKQVVSVAASNLTVLANPYPSAIDFGSLTKSNVKNTFYIWDPKSSGVYGLGAYVTVSFNTGTGNYDVTTSASSISQYIPSGEAVFIQSSNGTSTGTITIRESSKTTNGSDFIFGRNTPVVSSTSGTSIRANLYAYNTDGSYSILDGALTTFHKVNSNEVDEADAKKLYGASESIGFARPGSVLAIERRYIIKNTDTCFINLFQMKRATYRLDIVATEFDNTGLVAVIKDNYSGAINNRQLDLNGTTHIDFTTDANPASYAINRFKIVFIKNNPVTAVDLASKGNQESKANAAKSTNPEIETITSMVVYPNPVVSKTINVKVNQLGKGHFSLNLYNINGQLISAQAINSTSDNSIIKMNVPGNFSTGKYQLKLEGEGKTMTTSFLKK